MIKIFFITFFISELIIALSVIFKIYEFDRCVNNYNSLIESNKDEIKNLLVDIRELLLSFTYGVERIKLIIKLKKQEYFFKILKDSLLYGGIFLLRGKWSKYRNAFFSYQIIKDLYEGYKEAEVSD